MNKNLLYLIGGGAIAFVVYKMSQGNSLSVSPYAYPNGAYTNATLGGQPSEQYPYQAVAPPRVDNQSQPWAAQSPASQLITAPQGVNVNGQVQGFVDAANSLKSVASISDSLGSIWGNLSTQFGWGAEGVE